MSTDRPRPRPPVDTLAAEEGAIIAAEAAAIRALLPPPSILRLIDRPVQVAYSSSDADEFARGIILDPGTLCNRAGEIEPSRLRWINGVERNRGEYQCEWAMILPRSGPPEIWQSTEGSWSVWQGEGSSWRCERRPATDAELAESADVIRTNLAAVYAAASDAASKKASTLASRRARLAAMAAI